MSSRAKVKPPRQYSIADAINIAYSELEQLRDEVSEVCDNMEERLSHVPRYEALCECRDALDSAINDGEPSLPSWLTDDQQRGPYSDRPGRVVVADGGKLRSRADRRDDACMILSGAIEALKEIREEIDGAIPEDATEGDARLDDIDTVLDELQAIIDGADGAYFPRMYG